MPPATLPRRYGLRAAHLGQATSSGSPYWRPACSALSRCRSRLQRRIVNDAIKNGATSTIVWLAVAYAGVALLEQSLKLALNVYRAWVSEDAVRRLRRTLARRRARHRERRGRRHRRRATAMAGGRGRADRRLRRHGDLRAAAAGRHPGKRDRLHGLSRAVDAGAERGLPPAADAVRAADAARHQPPRRRAYQDPAPTSAAKSSSTGVPEDEASSACSRSTWASTRSSTA